MRYEVVPPKYVYMAYERGKSVARETDKASEACHAYGMGMDAVESGQAFECCPYPVRHAIGMHFMLRELMLHQEVAIRAASHALVMLFSTRNYSLDPLHEYRDSHGNTGKPFRIQCASNTYRGTGANAAGYTYWLGYAMAQSGIRVSRLHDKEHGLTSSRRDTLCESIPDWSDSDLFLVGECSDDRYSVAMEEDALVRPTRGLVRQFYRTIAPLFQPYMNHRWESDGWIPQWTVRRPRSTTRKQSLPRFLVQAMETIVAMLPRAMHQAFSGAWLNRNIHCVNVAQRREKFAMHLLANRLELNRGGLAFDVYHELDWLIPSVKPRTRTVLWFNNRSLVVDVPGLNDKEVERDSSSVFFA